MPLQLWIKSAEASGGGTEDVSLILGATESADRPFLTARFAVRRGAEGTTVKVDGLNLGNLTPEATEALWRAWPEARRGCGTGSGQLARLVLSGSVSVGRATTIVVTGEVRDLGLRLNVGGRDVDAEHLSVTAHVEGNLTGMGFRGLKLARAHCSWDTLGTGDWTLSNGTADVEVDGSEIVLSGLKSGLKSGLGEAEVEATGAYDTALGTWPRGRVWIRDLAAGALRRGCRRRFAGRCRTRLPGCWRRRIFLSESAPDHVAAYVECDCPEDLTFNVAPAAAGTGPAAGAGAGPAGPAAGTAGGMPRVVLTNGLWSGTVTWYFRGAQRWKWHTGGLRRTSCW